MPRRQPGRGATPGVRSFPPLSRPDARVLVLGSMPGLRSLQLQQYYGHPRNAFWPIMGRLFSFDPGSDYGERASALAQGRVAVWDVIERCERPGSLDADIREASIRANDFEWFFSAHPDLERICFNGRKAADTFRRHVASPNLRLPPTFTLPSTSPAYAALSFGQKLESWRRVVPGSDGDY